MTTPGSTAPLHQRTRVVLVALGAVVAVVVLNLGIWWLWPRPPSTTLHASTTRYDAVVTVDGLRAGTTGVDVTLTPRGPTTGTPSVQVQAVQPGMGYASAPVAATPGPTGSRADGVPLMFPGRWQLVVHVDDAAGSEDLVLPVVVTG